MYKEPLCRRYYGNIVGEAALFRFIIYLVAIILALVAAYATGGFWVRLKPVNVQATVHYTQDALLVFEVCTSLGHRTCAYVFNKLSSGAGAAVGTVSRVEYVGSNQFCIHR